MNWLKGLSLFILSILLLLVLFLYAGYDLCKSSNHAPSESIKAGLVKLELKELEGKTTVALLAEVPGDRAFVLGHGNSSSKLSMIPRAEMLAAMGYTVLIPDLNAHGETEGQWKTFGYRESQDIQNASLYLRNKLGKKWIGAIGASLGGASILKASSEGTRFEFIMIEAVFADIRTAARNRLEMKLGLMGPLMEPLLTLQLPIWTGVSRKDLRPSEWARGVHCPILVLTGSRDQRARVGESERIFAAIPIQDKVLQVIEGAEHEDLYEFDKEGYRKRLVSFLLPLAADFHKAHSQNPP